MICASHGPPQRTPHGKRKPPYAPHGPLYAPHGPPHSPPHGPPHWPPQGTANAKRKQRSSCGLWEENEMTFAKLELLFGAVILVMAAVVHQMH
jgi:hypothetical protein